MSEAVRLVVRGRVQGVGFRWFVRERARAAGVRGWVRNDADGSVELVAAGPSSAIEALVAAVHEGPPGADVTAVERHAADFDAALPDPFQVQR